ncbi:M4 family metallopeptidase [Streptomyces sp. NPDC049585]|uniref:M4 family metallopeptidase n=1 Tax=Streptomyces sp. NPDC049585 TaxID=3155154 RepID=UPI00341E77D4
MTAAAAALVASAVSAPAEARSAAGVARTAATGCGTGVGRVPLETTQDPATGRWRLDDPVRGHHRTYDLRGATGGPGVLVTDDDNSWCDTAAQADAVAAHYINAVVWDYFLTSHGRRGVRGDGTGGCSQVHYGNAYLNAFWADDRGCMVWGSGASRPNDLFRIEVGAHEMTHGVTAATANLTYSGESGALNEATSDIFAAAVEFAANNPADPGDYLFGERTDITGDHVDRRMDRPSWDGRSKDYWYPGIERLDVHSASGPADHFFYLLAEGSGRKVINGVAYDSPTYDGKPVAGIGREAAARIWYHALTNYMRANTTYHGARDLTLKAAADLYGAGSPQHTAVGAAWTAVNVG